MTTQQFALQTLKTIETSARSRYAMRFTDCKRLAKTLMSLGFGFLLHDLSPVAAQTLAVCRCGVSGAEKSLSLTEKTPKTVQKPAKIELRGITGEYYTLKSGEVREVWMSPTGRKYVYTTSGGKYYPKSLNISVNR